MEVESESLSESLVSLLSEEELEELSESPLEELLLVLLFEDELDPEPFLAFFFAGCVSSSLPL